VQKLSEIIIHTTTLQSTIFEYILRNDIMPRFPASTFFFFNFELAGQNTSGTGGGSQPQCFCFYFGLF
jgi:hypothetical protein